MYLFFSSAVWLYLQYSQFRLINYSDYGLVLNRQQVIIWISDDQVRWCVIRAQCVNSLALGRSLCDFKNVIFNLALLIGIFKSSYDNVLRWKPQDLTDDKSALVQVMAWCRQATSHYLSQCWLRSPMPYGVTRPQWVKQYCSCRPWHIPLSDGPGHIKLLVRQVNLVKLCFKSYIICIENCKIFWSWAAGNFWGCHVMLWTSGLFEAEHKSITLN